MFHSFSLLSKTPLHEVGKAPEYMCVRWSTDEELDHIFGTWTDSETVKRFWLRKWLEVEPFHCVKRAASDVGPNPGLEPFTKYLH